MPSILKYQYEWVCDAREVLLNCCATLSAEQLTQAVPGFIKGSVRNLLIHNAACYQYWIGKFALQQSFALATANEFVALQSIRVLYQDVNVLVATFLQQFENQLETPLVGKNFEGNKTLELSPMQLLTHVFTHEFHHKGQMLAMIRQLGYPPPDTDIIRS